MGLIQATLLKIRNNNDLFEQVKSLYDEESGREKVAQFLGVNYGTVGHILKELGLQTDRVSRRKIVADRVRNRNPFNDGDFGDYLKGFILGDGSIGCDCGVATSIIISSSDYNFLETLRRLWDDTLLMKGPNRGNYFIVCRDRNLVKVLLNQGFVPSKSKVGMVLDCNITWPLVRGLFDSDGCVTTSNGGKTLRMYLYGHPSYMKQFAMFLSPFNPHILNRDKLMGISFYNQDVIQRISNLMYDGATIKLDRKYERFQQYFKY